MKKHPFSILLIRRNICLVFLCLMIAICIVCMVNINTAYTERADNAGHLLAAHQVSADQSIHLVTRIVYQITREPFFNEYLLCENEMNYYMLQILNSLNLRLSTIDNCCYSVGIIRDGSSFVLSSRQSASLDSYLEDIQLSRSAYDHFIETVPYSVNGTYLFLEEEDSFSPYLTMGTKFSYQGNSTLCILISYYKEFFTRPFSGKAQLHILSGNKVRVDSCPDPFDSRAGAVLRILDGYSALNNERIRIRTGGIIYTAVPSTVFSGWYVLSEPVPLSWWITNILLTLAIVCTSAAIFLVLKTTQRLVKPIDTAIDLFRPFSGETGSPRGDISYLSTAAERLILENKTLSSRLDRRMHSLKTYFLTDALLGILPDEEIALGIAEYGLEYLNEEIIVSILDFRYDDTATDIEILELKTALPRIIVSVNTEHLIQDYVPFRSKYILLFSGAVYEKTCKLLGTLLAKLEEDYGLHLIAAVGTPADTPCKWKDSFNIALDLLEHKYVLSPKDILLPEDLARVTDNGFYYPLDIEVLLINQTVMQERSKVHLIIGEIIAKNFTDKDSPGQIPGLNQAMAYTITRCLQRINATAGDVFEEGTVCYLELKMCENQNELRDTLFALFDRIMEYISCASRSSRLTAQSFENYIAQSFYRDVSLPEVAEHFRLSVPYTSKIIKNVTGQSFKEYLNRYRIHEAKKIFLQNKGMQINQIARKVGFTNANTFIRVFKSIEGISPGQFRREAEEKEE